jgi:hypothetical protein
LDARVTFEKEIPVTKDTVSIFECWNENLKEVLILISRSSLDELKEIFKQEIPTPITHWDVTKHTISCEVVEHSVLSQDAEVFAKAYSQSRTNRGYRFLVGSINA